MASSSGPKLSREEYKKAKELDAARKAGTAAPELDEEGRILNPHTWNVIQKTPWYLGYKTPTLKHQKNWKEHETASLDQWYAKGKDVLIAESVGGKFKKGACENCGAVTHKKQDCLERPRKIGAKHLDRQLAPDEVAQSEIPLDFEGKRDRWNGYDTNEFAKVVADYQKVDMAKRMLKAEKLQQEIARQSGSESEGAGSGGEDRLSTRAKRFSKTTADSGDGPDSGTETTATATTITTAAATTATSSGSSSSASDAPPQAGDEDGSDGAAPSTASSAQKKDGSEVAAAVDSDSEGEEDEFRYGEEELMPGQKWDPKKRISVRNLRIREDTAKYLYNLDIDSAYYDPKSRAMKENPFAGTGKDVSDLKFAGDNFIRYTGDMKAMAQSQMFAWEAAEHGAEVHMQADPTKVELARRQFDVKKETLKSTQKSSILEKYGGAEHLEAPPKELLLSQSENYVEYSRSGKVLKGQEKLVPRSKYEEDVLVNNHTQIWGSYWESGKWGYGCCHSLIKNSFCVGEAGIVANASKAPGSETASSSSAAPAALATTDNAEASKSLVEQHRDSIRGKRRREQDDAPEDREAKIKEAMEKISKQEREAEGILAMDERARSYNSLKDFGTAAPSEAELEAFKRKRARSDDPMANYEDKDL